MPFDDKDSTLADLLIEQQLPWPAERMKPLPNSAVEGRVNPKGIPCLYLATDAETAMSEVRPWLAETITLGKFETARDLKLVDFAVHHDTPPTFDLEMTPPEVVEAVWAFVDKTFARPVGENVVTADYAPTQIIAETFRRNSFNGIRYKSRLGPGFNVALFELDSAELVEASLCKATGVKYMFATDKT